MSALHFSEKPHNSVQPDHINVQLSPCSRSAGLFNIIVIPGDCTKQTGFNRAWTEIFVVRAWSCQSLRIQCFQHLYPWLEATHRLKMALTSSTLMSCKSNTKRIKIQFTRWWLLCGKQKATQAGALSASAGVTTALQISYEPCVGSIKCGADPVSFIICAAHYTKILSNLLTRLANLLHTNTCRWGELSEWTKRY